MDPSKPLTCRKLKNIPKFYEERSDNYFVKQKILHVPQTIYFLEIPYTQRQK
jgi:hypothetical protein